MQQQKPQKPAAPRAQLTVINGMPVPNLNFEARFSTDTGSSIDSTDAHNTTLVSFYIIDQLNGIYDS
jgi:hypothetical protein